MSGLSWCETVSHGSWILGKASAFGPAGPGRLGEVPCRQRGVTARPPAVQPEDTVGHFRLGDCQPGSGAGPYIGTRSPTVIGAGAWTRLEEACHDIVRLGSDWWCEEAEGGLQLRLLMGPSLSSRHDLIWWRWQPTVNRDV